MKNSPRAKGAPDRREGVVASRNKSLRKKPTEESTGRAVEITAPKLRNESSAERDSSRKRIRVLMQQRDPPEKFQRRDRGGWGPDWSALHRTVEGQLALGKFIVEKLPPDFILILWIPGMSSIELLFRKLRELRNRRYELYSRDNLPLKIEKPEYIAAFERGMHPRLSRDQLFHLHVLFYNASRMTPRNIRAVWKEINRLKTLEGCHVTKFRGDRGGSGYSLKTFGSNADRIEISRKLPQIAETRMSETLGRGWPRRSNG
jgi:hypothetical protein